MAFRDRRNIKACGEHFKIGRLACSLCNHYPIGSSLYVIILGLIGSIITAADVMRAVSCKIPRVSSRHRNNREGNARKFTSHYMCNILMKYESFKANFKYWLEEGVPVTVERDLKLMVSILGFEHYTLIMLGTITEYPMLYTPWLLMHLCVILVEIVVFFVRFFLDGLHVKRNEMLRAMFTLYNWLQVFCLFYRQTRRVA